MNKDIDDKGIFGRSLVVSIGYTLVLLIGGRITTISEAALSEASGGESVLWKSLLPGILIGLTLGMVASQLKASRLRHFFIWSCVVFLNFVSVILEGAFFAPGLVSKIIPSFIFQQLLAALVIAFLVSILFVPPDKIQVSSMRLKRPWYAWVWRFVGSSLSYLVFYFIFGAINYALVTKPYYETHISSLTTSAP